MTSGLPRLTDISESARICGQERSLIQAKAEKSEVGFAASDPSSHEPWQVRPHAADLDAACLVVDCKRGSDFSNVLQDKIQYKTRAWRQVPS
jgi:hypothetical protein